MRLLRWTFALFALLLLVTSQATKTLALQNGAISGHVTDANTNAPVGAAQVSAVGSTGKYVATTTSTGFYSIVGLAPDTYVVTVSKQDYEATSETGITVTQGVSVKIDLKLQPATKTIGRVPVRANRPTLVQPDVVTDAYDITVYQQDTLKGTPLASEQFGLLTELPGVSSAGGYPILRGGLENNEGFQIEGITVVDPFFNQFSNNDTYNGAQSIKVVLGPGDATQGGAGSGYINEVVKRGAYPAFGTLQTEFGFGARQNNLNFEYGNATPDNRFSYFLSGRYGPLQAAGPYKPNQSVQGIPLNDQLGALANVVATDSVANLYYRFGQNASNQLQVYDEHGLQNFLGPYGISPFSPVYYAFDPFYQQFTPLLPSQLPLYPNQPPSQPFPNIPGQIQEYELTKIALSHQFNDTTFLSSRIYRLNGNTRFNLTQSDYPYLSLGFPSLFNDFYEETPYQTTGIAFDLQKQLGDKHFVSFGSEYKFSGGRLTLDFPPSLAFVFLPNEIADFVPGGGGQFDPAVLGRIIRLPLPQFGTQDPEYVSDTYITDQFKPTSHLTIQPGLRYETQRIHEPGGLYDVHALAPKLGASYAFSDQNTVLRASFGHSTVFAPLGQVENIYEAPSYFHNFAATASICGGAANGFSLPCRDYFDQIVNDLAATIGIAPSSFPKPQGSDSYDLSLEHQFKNGVSMKLTPWYRRDYNVIVTESLPIIIAGTVVNGPETVTNNGFGHSFGIDLGLDRYVPQGLSGQFNVTYINQFINYLSNGAFLPSVLPSTLATVVHPPYLSPFDATLALDYKRNGWRVNPILTYSKGTPQGLPEFYYVKINGIYQAVPNTNYFGNPNTPCFFVDPQIPGTPANPNIVGSLGGGCSKARNGTLGLANIVGQITISKDITRHSTAGFTIFNLFNNQTFGLYNGLAGGNFSYINNGFGAYGSGSGFSQYGPNGVGIRGAPAVFPPGPFFNTESGAGRSALLFVNVKI